MSLVSCHDESVTVSNNSLGEKVINLTPKELLSISFEESQELSEPEIVELLNEFRKNEGFVKLSSDAIAIKRKHEIEHSISNKNFKSFIYEVDIETADDKYTAIVSGDKRFPFVLSYFHNGNQRSNQTCNMLSVEYSQKVMSEHIRNLEMIKDSLRDNTVKKIATNLSVREDKLNINEAIKHVKIKNSTRSSIILNPPTDAIAGNGPFINVSWDEGMPYNRLMEQSCSDNWLWDYRYPISSIVVTTAEVLSYFRPSMTIDGIKIDWDYLCKNEEIHEESDYFGGYEQDPLDKRNMIATLMKYIGTECQVNYSCSSSSVNFNNVIAFLNKYNIKINNKQNLDVTNLKYSIDDFEPVIMYGKTSSGGGHWWVVDGYRAQTATRGTFFPGYNIYMHANMGMGKSYTGYYLVGTNGSLTFDSSFAHFNTDLVMYTNIRE